MEGKQMNKQDALKNQALYWRGFAYLAVHGQRTLENWHAACITSCMNPPTDEEVGAILDEAKNLMTSKGKAA
jgi:hypothetical protein